MERTPSFPWLHQDSSLSLCYCLGLGLPPGGYLVQRLKGGHDQGTGRADRWRRTLVWSKGATASALPRCVAVVLPLSRSGIEAGEPQNGHTPWAGTPRSGCILWTGNHPTGLLLGAGSLQSGRFPWDQSPQNGHASGGSSQPALGLRLPYRPASWAADIRPRLVLWSPLPYGRSRLRKEGSSLWGDQFQAKRGLGAAKEPRVCPSCSQERVHLRNSEGSRLRPCP